MDEPDTGALAPVALPGRLGPVGGWLRPVGSRARDRRRRRLGAVCEGLALGLSFRRACSAAGVRYSSWCRWRATGPDRTDLGDAIDRAYELGTQHLEDLALARVTSGDHRSDRLLEFLLASRRPERYSAKRDVRVRVEVLERKLLVLPVEAVEVLAVEARVVELLGAPAGDDQGDGDERELASGPASASGPAGASIGPRARADPRPRARSPEVLNSSTHSLRENLEQIDAADIHLPDLPAVVEVVELLLPEIPVALEDSFAHMQRARGSGATAPEGPPGGYPTV